MRYELKASQVNDIIVDGVSLRERGYVATDGAAGFALGEVLRSAKQINQKKYKNSPFFMEIHRQTMPVEYQINVMNMFDGRVDIKDIYDIFEKSFNNYVKIEFDIGDMKPYFYGVLSSELVPTYYTGTDKGYFGMVFTSNGEGLMEVQEVGVVSNTEETFIIENSSQDFLFPVIELKYDDEIVRSEEYSDFEVKWQIDFNKEVELRANELYTVDIKLSNSYTEYSYKTYSDFITSFSPTKYEKPTLGLRTQFSRLQIKSEKEGQRTGIAVPPNSTVEIKLTNQSKTTSGWSGRIYIERLVSQW